MLPRVVEVEGMFVEPHHKLDLPSRGIALPCLGRREVGVADEDDRTEAYALLPVVIGIVVVVPLPVAEVVVLLLQGPGRIAERVEEPAVRKGAFFDFL